MRVLYRKQIFEQYKEVELEQGLTFCEIVDQLDFPREISSYINIRVDGALIYPSMWVNSRPKAGSVTSVCVIPAGGSDSGELLKTVAVIGIALYTGGATASGGLGWSAGAVAAATMVSGLALNALFPPPQPNLTGDPDRTSVNSITGQSNRADPYGVVIRGYGRNRIYPRVAAEPFTYFVGDTQYLTALYDFGLSNDFEYELQEASLQLGESALSGFEGVQYAVAKNPSELTIYKNKTNTENFNVEFKEIADNSIKVSPESSESIDLKFTFPQGLTTIVGAKRVKRTTTIGLSVKVRPVGTPYWTDFNTYDYEIDKKYEVDNFRYLNVDLIPDTYIVVDSYSGNTGSFISWVYTKYRIIHDSNIIKFSINLDAGDEYIPIPKDSLIIPGAQNGGRDALVRIDEVIGSEEVMGTLIWEVRLTENMRIDYTMDGYSIGQQPIGSQLKSFTDLIKVKANTTSGFRFNLKVNFNRKDQWEVWVNWVSLDVEYIGSSPQYINDFVWSGIVGYTSSVPIAVNDSHTYLELKIQATGQLNGNIDNLSGIIFSILDYYDTSSSTWKRKATSNPAWIFVDILTGSSNQRAIPKSKIDIDSIVRWANYCEQNTITYQGNTVGFECNFVLDYTITVKELLLQVCSVGRATLNINSGKFGVIIDEEKNTPTQIFNQRNIKSMNVSRQYTETPQAIKATFIDPASNWQKNEVMAYDDGETRETATIIEEIDMFAVTSLAQAWRQGRYFLAQQKLRRNNVSINVDFENLACSRGDLVLFSHDAMKVGGLPARVISISGNEVTLDEPVNDQAGTYVLRSRVRATDEVIDLPVISFVDTHTVEVSSLGGLQWDDLVVFGESETVTRNYIVKSITYANDYDASIELIEYAPEIFDADSGVIPDYVSTTQGDPLAGGVYPGAVTDLVVDYNVECSNSEKRYVYIASLEWEAPIGHTIDNYEVYLTVDGQQQLIGFTKNRKFIYNVSALSLNLEHKFTVIGVDGAGRKMPLENATSVLFTPTEDTTVPEDISEFNANLLTETIQLDWRLVSDCDIDRYYVRYSPKTENAIWAQSTKVTSTANNQNSVQVPIRTGTYFVKAQDWAGNISNTAAFLVTQIPEVLNVEFISEVDAPAWSGVYEETELVGSKLKLRSTDGDVTYSDTFGNFYFDDVFDLGDVFTARFTSSILAGGYSRTSIIENWATMSSIDPIAGSFSEDDFDVAAYIRTRNEASVMSTWATLESVDYLSFGTELTATPWQRFTNADFTGRIFQLKLQLEGNADQTVSPVVYESNITANWVERVAKGKDILSGTNVVFTHAFTEVPAIQVTSSENINTGDYHKFTSKSAEGFTVQFYDSSDNPISTPKYDWLANGIGKKYTL